MNDLTTIKGFYETYLKLLKQYKNKEECFNFLNKEVEKINGEKMFLNINDFEMRALGIGLETPFDFCRTYFNLLPYFPSSKDCFEYMNKINIEVGEKVLFLDYRDFRQRTWND